MSDRKDLRSLTYDELCAYMESIKEKSFRAGQVFDWLHAKKINDIEGMTNIPESLRGRLSDDFCINATDIVKTLVSSVDGTRKYLHRLSDGNIIETVLLRYEHGNSVCISSQVGCRMGCKFCASTVDGLVRNLTAGEMAGQVYSVEADIGERVGNVVVMGSGEPMDNFDAFCDFVEIITDKRGANLSGRNITVSTCGIVEKIRELADRKYAITLALSLHAVTDEKRRQIMPIANKYALSDVIDACEYYFDTTGRRITLEYSVIEGFNDGADDAEGLSGIARRLKCHINLIPVNPIRESKYRAGSRNCAIALKNKLEKNNINVTIRREMGRDIDASCGQLRRSYIQDNNLGEDNA